MRNPPSRTRSSKGIPTPCCSKVGIKRGPWTPQEDELLANYINKEGEGQWRTLPQRAGLRRCGKSCRLRWMNYLRPCVKRGRIALDEEDLILRLHRLLGNRWSLIAGRIPGRTDNEIKNYWNTHLSKKLLSQGIDPRTHKPLIANPNLINSSQKIPNNIISAPIQNSTTANSFPLEENDRVYRAVPTRVSEKFTMTTNLQDKVQNQVVDDDDDADAGEKNWPNCDGLINMELQNGHHAQNNEDDQDYNIGNNGNEDTLSSFLDSLLNENVFMYQQRQQLQQPDMIGPSAAGQPIVPSSQAFNHGNINWEAEVTSSMAALGHDEDGA